MASPAYHRRDPQRPRLFPFLGILFILIAGLPAAGADLTLEMPGAIKVGRDPFLLKEVAILSGDPELLRRVGEVKVPFPPDGVLTREALLSAIRDHGIGGVRLALVMAPQVRVSMDDSLSAIIKALSGWEWEVEATPLGAVPPGFPQSPPFIAPGTGSATLKYGDERGGERSLAVRLQWRRPALVAARPLERGRILSKADVTLQTVKVLRSAPLALSDEEVLGKVLRKNLSAGEPLALNYLGTTPIIQRGDPVIILVSKGSITIQVNGEALDSGSPGDIIRVRNLQSRLVIQAVAVSPGRVEVQD